MAATFGVLPVEIVATVLGNLDIPSLVSVSCTSKRLRFISADDLLNPWRAPILRCLLDDDLTSLRNLSVLSTVPRTNWLEILALATPNFILFEITLPNLSEDEWHEAFRRRFLPSWQRWNRGGRWREAFMRTLWKVWHRTQFSCTVEDSWTDYILLHRNRTAEHCSSYSRSFDPFNILDAMKSAKNLSHLQSHSKLIVEFADVRIYAFGVLSHNSSFFVNPNASMLIRPPGVKPDCRELYEVEGSASTQQPLDHQQATPQVPATPISPTQSPVPQAIMETNEPVAPLHAITRTLSADSASSQQSTSLRSTARSVLRRLTFSGRISSPTRAMPLSMGPLSPTQPNVALPPSEIPLPLSPPTQKIATQTFYERPRYSPIVHPTPHVTHRQYPNFTRGGGDRRWTLEGMPEDVGKVWVGPMVIAAQLVSHHRMKEVSGMNRSHWAAFGWEDLWAIAPWMEEKIERRIGGLGGGMD